MTPDEIIIASKAVEWLVGLQMPVGEAIVVVSYAIHNDSNIFDSYVDLKSSLKTKEKNEEVKFNYPASYKPIFLHSAGEAGVCGGSEDGVDESGGDK